MEMLGILLAIPFGFFASFAYAYFAEVNLTKRRFISRGLLIASWIVLALLLSELAVVNVIGVLNARKTIGPIFVLAHKLAILFSTPALANVVLLPKPYRFRPRWFLMAIPCFLLAMFLLLYNIHFTDVLYGPDGVGGPYDL
jgi:hypothetical protein